MDNKSNQIGMGATVGDEVRELRVLLQVCSASSVSMSDDSLMDLNSARNDVMQYASRMRRLELQLAKVQGEAAAVAATRESVALDQPSDVDLRVDEATAASHAWTHVLKAAEQALQQCSCRGSSRATELIGLQRFLLQQQQLFVELGHENAKLRDQLRVRPTRSQLVTIQLEVEHLRDALRNSARSKRSLTAPSLLEPLPSHTLSERMAADRLLSWLRVETKPQPRSPGRGTNLQRPLLKDLSVQCYLILDPAVLASRSIVAASDKEDSATGDQMNRDQQQLKGALKVKVGSLCSEIVATCCHVLRVERVGELPQAVQTASRLANIAPTLQRFLSKLQAVLHRLDEEKSRFALPKTGNLPHEDLESLLERAEDVTFELNVRRKHMNNTSGVNTFDVIFELMTLLQVTQADQLQSIVLRLIESSRTEKLFVLQLRELLGLKNFTTRDDIFKLITKLVQQLKLTSKQQQTTKEARTKQSQRT